MIVLLSDEGSKQTDKSIEFNKSSDKNHNYVRIDLANPNPEQIEREIQQEEKVNLENN